MAMALPLIDPHPEIPTGHYCYDERGVCPHWHETDKGARCDLINEEHTELCMWHLVWDQVKECGIKLYEEGERPYKNPNRPQGKEEVVTCYCGRQVQVIRTSGWASRRRKEEQDVEPTLVRPVPGPGVTRGDSGAET